MEDGLIKLKKLREDAILPVRKTPGSSGMDLFSPFDFSLYPGQVEVIKLGFAVQIPIGCEWQIRPRSSFGKKKILMPNAPGTIDSDFRGEVGVELLYTGYGHKTIERGDSIAQAVLCFVSMEEYEIVDELDNTLRGPGGFGSTGR